jgi:hypothetical protein
MGKRKRSRSDSENRSLRRKLRRLEEKLKKSSEEDRREERPASPGTPPPPSPSSVIFQEAELAGGFLVNLIFFTIRL